MRFEDDQMKFLQNRIVEIVDTRINKLLDEELSIRINKEVEAQIDNRLRRLARTPGDKE